MSFCNYQLCTISQIAETKVKVNKQESLIRGIVKGVPLHPSNEDILASIRSNIEVLSVIRQKRFNKELKKLEDSLAVLVTFKSNLLPSSIWFCGRNRELHTYNRRVIQCFKCQKYGHIQKDCHANQPICLRCAGKHSSAECHLKNNQVTTNKDMYKCANCLGNHSSTSPACQIRLKNKEILNVAEKYQVSFKRAQVMYRSYAQAVYSSAVKPERTSVNRIWTDTIESMKRQTITGTVNKILIALALSPEVLSTGSAPIAEKWRRYVNLWINSI